MYSRGEVCLCPGRCRVPSIVSTLASTSVVNQLWFGQRVERQPAASLGRGPDSPSPSRSRDRVSCLSATRLRSSYPLREVLSFDHYAIWLIIEGTFSPGSNVTSWDSFSSCTQQGTCVRLESGTERNDSDNSLQMRLMHFNT